MVSLTPVVSAALGAAAGFYCLSSLFRSGFFGTGVLFALLLFPLAFLCFFRALSSFSQSRLPRLGSLYGAAFAAGLALGMGAGGAGNLSLGFGMEREAVRGISGVLLEDPAIVAGGRAAAMIALRETFGPAGLRVSAKGELRVFFPEESALRLRDFGRGSSVFTEGALRERKEGRGFYFISESMHITKRAPALERFRTGIRTGLIRRFEGASSGPGPSWGGLALALLLGVKDNLDFELASRYRDAGCSYVLALSGMHLAVLAALIALLLKKPLGLKPAACAGALIVILYCFIVGPLPSLYRAAIMYLLGVLAVLGSLRRDGVNLLCMAFLVQLILAPASGRSVSFILSYLALAGILISGESLAALGRGKIPDILLKPLSASIGAFLATAGITAFIFGSLRPAGIIAGLALVPLTTVFMVASLAWLALNLFSPFLSDFLSPPLSLLYSLMEKTVSAAARLPGISAAHPLPAIALSLGLSVFIVVYEYRRRYAKNRLLSFD